MLTPLSLYINFFWVTWLFGGMVTFVGETGTFQPFILSLAFWTFQRITDSCKYVIII